MIECLSPIYWRLTDDLNPVDIPTFQTLSKEPNELSYSIRAKTLSLGSLWSVSTPEVAPPPLDSDISEDNGSLISIPRIPRARKERSSGYISFRNCSDNHPLQQDVSRSTQKERTPRRPIHSTVIDSSNNKSSTIVDEWSDISLREIDYALGEDKELILYDIRVKQLIGNSRRRQCRQNSEYLRMYAAERQLLLRRKITHIPTQLVLPPRNDSTTPSATETYLEIPCGWQKTRGRRVWRQLTADDFNCQLASY